MNKYKLIIIMQKELRALNERIDRKIIKGEPYRRDARRHKALLRQFSTLTAHTPKNRVFGLFSLALR